MTAPFTNQQEAQAHYAGVSARLRGAPPAPTIRRPPAATQPVQGLREGDVYAAIGRLVIEMILAVADDQPVQPRKVLAALDALAPVRRQDTETRITTLFVIETAAELFQVSPDELRICGRRARGLARPRHLAMAAAVRLTRRSRHEISRTFRCDHSTITSAHNRIDALIQDDPEAAAQLARLEDEVRRRWAARPPV